jgi:hypothetical protein
VFALWTFEQTVFETFRQLVNGQHPQLTPRAARTVDRQSSGSGFFQLAIIKKIANRRESVGPVTDFDNQIGHANRSRDFRQPKGKAATSVLLMTA